MYLAIDVGGTKIKVGATEHLDKPNFESVVLPFTNNFENDIVSIQNTANSLIGDSALTAVGICSPGRIENGVCKSGRNISGWIEGDVRANLQLLGTNDVFYHSDSYANAIGESTYGAGGNLDYVIWGTGIGGARVTATEEGLVHEPLNWTEYFKDWEMECGGGELAKRFGNTRLFSDEQWDEIIRNFLGFLNTYIDKMNPEKLIIGGGLATLHKSEIEHATETNNALVQVTKLGDDSGLYGALILVMLQRSA